MTSSTIISILVILITIILSIWTQLCAFSIVNLSSVLIANLLFVLIQGTSTSPFIYQIAPNYTYIINCFIYTFTYSRSSLVYYLNVCLIKN